MEHLLGDAFEAIISPFEGDAPYGDDVKYGDRYEAIQHEIQKLTAASSKETFVDWKAVRDLSIELLREESKDLTIACFLTVALFIEDKYGGARDGLEIIRTFIEDHWEGVFPPIKRIPRRAADFRWLVDRLAPLIEDRGLQPSDCEHLDLMVEHATAISDRSRDLLKEKSPGFGVLISALKSRAAEAASLAPSQTPTESTSTVEDGTGSEATIESSDETTENSQEASTAPQKSPASPAAAPPAPPTAAGISINSDASASQIRSQLESAIKPLRDADRLSPSSYRILRVLKWEGVSGPPVAGETRIPGPRPNELTPLQTMFQASNWSGLLDTTENMFKAGHIWLLDLQRFSVLCLEKLDPNGPQSTAANAIKDATSELLKRNPLLVDCLYADGLPFASDETRAWLTEILGAEDSRVQIARPTENEDRVDAFEPGDLERAIEFFRAQQSTEAAEVLQRGIRRAPDGRSKFRARLDASRACLDANQAERARPMLERLRRDANDLTFESWEQAWAIELLQLLAICYGRLVKAAKGDDQKRFSEMLNSVLDTLSGIDMQAAAAVQEEIG